MASDLAKNFVHDVVGKNSTIQGNKGEKIALGSPRRELLWTALWQSVLR